MMKAHNFDKFAQKLWKLTKTNIGDNFQLFFFSNLLIHILY